MNHINVPSDWFMGSFSSRTDAVLKTFPEDFIVQELTPISHENSNDNLNRKTETKARRDDTNLEKLSMDDILNYINYTDWAKLMSLNAGEDMLNDEFRLKLHIDREKRYLLKLTITQHLPYLSVRYENVEANDISTWIFRQELKLKNGLLLYGMSVNDIEFIYKFKNLGPSHSMAKLGIRVGFNLLREQRSNCFRILKSYCPSLDSKTMECHRMDQNNQTPNLNNEGKFMLIHWSPKSMRSAVKYFNRQDNLPDDKVVKKDEVYLGFILMKQDVEHMHAIEQLANCVGVSPGQISVAGVKDKRAVTFQRCCITLYPPTKHRNKTDQNESEKCLKYVPIMPFNEYQGDELVDSDEVDTKNSNMRIASVSVTTPTIDIQHFCREVSPGIRNSLITVISNLLVFTPRYNEKYIQYSSRQDENKSSSSSFILVDKFHLLQSALNLGDLVGNRFQICLRNLVSFPSTLNNYLIFTTLHKSVLYVENQGFPNFYGSQRMGYTKTDRNRNYIMTAHSSPNMPMGPSIGRLLLRCAYEEAIHAIVLDSLSASDSCDRNTTLEDISVQTTGYSDKYLSITRNTNLSTDQYILCLKDLLRDIPHSASRARTVIRAMIRYRFGYPKYNTNDELFNNSRENNITVSDSIDTVMTVPLDIDDVNDLLMEEDIIPSKCNSNSNSNSDCLKECEYKADVIVLVLQQIPRSIRTLWISSYQSWIWNKVAHYRLSQMPVEAQPGDLVFSQSWKNWKSDKQQISIVGIKRSRDTEGLIQTVELVSEEDIRNCTVDERIELMQYIVLPLFGSKVIYPTNESGR
jgi:tRNA(Glu) U13 pseudouridine synthase TruD